MANTLYKTAVEELEAVLPPRLVSQSLHEGLAALGKTAETLTKSDAETLLRERMLSRLTHLLGEARAQETLQDILGRLSELPDEAQTPPLSLEAQARAVRLLREALKPFNVYFEWGETQKLRAQLSLIETEHKEGHNVGELIAAAQTQLGVLRQKLSDQLSLQARELTLLEAAWQETSVLGTPKVRRLASLLDLIRSAQEAQQRAPAEVERAHKLADELRAEKLRRSGEEARELRALEESFSTLLNLDPALAARLAEYQRSVAEETLLGDALTDFRSALENVQEALRSTLQNEFLNLSREVSSPELTQLLTLSLKVLETTLPPATDVQRVRDLARAGSAGSAGLADFHRLEAEAEPYRELPNELGRSLETFLTTARGALERGLNLPDLEPARTLVQRAQEEGAKSAQSFVSRVAAARSAAAPLTVPSSEDDEALRWRLQELEAQQGSAQRVSPKRQAELEAALRETEALIAALQDEASATRSVAAELLQSSALDDALGFLGAPATATPAAQTLEPTPVPTPASAPSALQGWLGHQAAHEGVAGLALFTPTGTDAGPLVAGKLPTDAETLARAVRVARGRADTLGRGLQRDATSLTVETPECTLVVFWLRARSLVLVTRAPTWGGAARQRLEAALPELVTLLE